MNEPDSNMSDAAEWRDKLLDRGLREVLGRETPPDLSDKILTAVAGALDASVTSGDARMNTEKLKPRSHRRWVYLAVAASLLMVAGGLLLPSIPNAREGAQRNRPATAGPSTDVATAASGALADGESSVGELRQPSGSRRAVQLRAAVTEGGQAPAGAESQSATSSFASGLQLMVTPHVVVEEERLGAGLAASATGATQVTDGAKGVQIEGQSRAFADSYAATEAAVAGKPAAAARYLYRPQGGQAASRGGAVVAQAPAESALRLKEDALGDVLAEEVRQLDAIQAVPELTAGQQDWGTSVLDVDAGRGPSQAGDQYARIVENDFKAISAATTHNRLSTFSIDVDTASYANVRQFLLQSGMLPPPDAVRIEELVNYFDYDYSAPTGDAPFAANIEVAGCPWTPDHRLVRVGIKGREIEQSQRPQSNLVFLIDVSGSMDEPNKLPLLLDGMRMLTRELSENDRVAIVVYASTEGLALKSTPGTDQSTILAALDQLRAGGSTAGGAGIQLAYEVATDNFIKGGVNRVILCTDGDFNVGVTSPAELERMAEAKAKETGVFLTVLGFGRGNLNDAMMEQIADKGNGNYHYVDTRNEARKVLVEEMVGTLVAIAKDVKIQIEFNPAKVAGYRLIGYENRVMAAEDFNNDQKDAGEIGAGHTVTALYEVAPAGQKVDAAMVDDLKYGGANAQAAEDDHVATEESAESSGDDLTDFADELLTLKIRYKAPDGDASTKLEFPVTDSGQAFGQATNDFKFASAVASFGMLLRDSQYKGNATYAAVQEIAESASGRDPHGYRKEFAEMIQRARELSGR